MLIYHRHKEKFFLYGHSIKGWGFVGVLFSLGFFKHFWSLFFFLNM